MSAKKSTAAAGKMSTLNIVLIIQLVIMLGLSVFITMTVSKAAKKNAIDNMTAITEERAHMIETFVQNAEKTLTYYSKAQQIVDMFKNPDDANLKAVAQAYTEDFGAEIEYNEGLWSGLVSTEVMTHSSAPKNAALIGMITRKDETRRKQLEDALIAAGDGVYNTGIIISPASGKQCLSLYKGVFDNNKLIGFVGLGIYTEGLIDNLDKVRLPGVENSFYTMANAKDGTYIFNNDAEKIGTEVEHDELKNKCSELSNATFASTGDYEYEKSGTNYVSIYSYIPEYGWILTIDDESSEVYELNRTMIIYLSVFAFIILGLTVVFYFITKRQQKINQKLVSTIAKANLTKKSLNTAMFKDVLTGASNRISLSMDMEKIDQAAEEPYYFAMFNICNFSAINLEYGSEAGDRLLVRAVEDLKDYFSEDQIYRTGSDEFVVSLKTENGLPFADDLLDKVNNAFRQMLVPERLDDGRTIYPKYKVAVLKKAKAIDISVVTTLKEMTNKKGEASYGMIDFKDMTT